jgi:hypothetical protein
VDLSVGHCWDCPAPILQTLIPLAISLAFLGAVVRLASTRSVALRAVGVFGTALALLFYLLIAASLIKYGVAWHANMASSRLAEFLVMSSWLALSTLLVIRLRQRYRRRQAPMAGGV